MDFSILLDKHDEKWIDDDDELILQRKVRLNGIILEFMAFPKHKTI